jgi:hypothetical protein
VGLFCNTYIDCEHKFCTHQYKLVPVLSVPKAALAANMIPKIAAKPWWKSTASSLEAHGQSDFLSTPYTVCRKRSTAQENNVKKRAATRKSAYRVEGKDQYDNEWRDILTWHNNWIERTSCASGQRNCADTIALTNFFLLTNLAQLWSYGVVH